MKVETLEHVEITKIKPYEKNYQSHELNKEHIKNSIEDFNFDVPVVVDPNYVIVKGHGRYEALLDLGHKTIPLVIVNHTLDTPEKAAAARIADNESSRAAQVDQDILKGEVLEIGDFFDMGDYGLNMDLMGDDEEEETEGEDDVPEAAPAVTVKGDLYELGKHRVLCGDSTVIDDVEKLMDGKKADMVFTDPPYRYKPMGDGGPFIGHNNLKKSLEGLVDFNPEKLLNALPELFDKKMNAYIFCNTDLVPDYCHWARKCKYNFNILTWHKKQFIPANNNHHYPDTEYLIYISKGAIFNTGLEVNYGKYFILDNEKSDDHPTIKPISVIENELRISSNTKSIVVDLFLGSGSTLIACEKTDRKCYGIELDEKHCDVIVKRYVDFCKKNNKKYSVKRNGAICSEFDD